MDNPDLDRNTVLAKQREMLCAKSQRLERIIASIDEMLKEDQLENAHECLPGIEHIAVLEDYGSDKHVFMKFDFAKNNRVAISGKFLNSNTLYKSGIFLKWKQRHFMS